MSDDFDGRALLHGGLSTSMMAAFSYHTEGVRFGPGQKIGVGIAVAVAIMDAFFPPQPTVDPDPVATKQEVEDALKSMTQGVIDDEWWFKISAIQHDISNQKDRFYGIWDDLMNNVMVKGQDASLQVATNLTLDQFIDGTFAYLNPMSPIQLLTILRKARYTLENSSLNDTSLTSLQVAQHQTLTIGIYALIGSLTTTYLKACIAWAWGREQQLSWRYAAYQQELDAAQGDDAKVQAVEDKYKDVNSTTGYEPLGWNDFVAKTPGSAVGILKNEVQSLLDYCVTIPATTTKPAQDGLYTSMWKDLTDFDTKIASYDVVPASAITKADMMTAVANGCDRSGQWETLDIQNARLKYVPEDDIVLLKQNIETWKAASATVRFEVYEVPQGGVYIDDLAKAKYGDESFMMDLIHANSDVLNYDALFPPPPIPKGFFGTPPPQPRPGFVNPGTRLRIFELDAVPYILNPPQAV